MIDERLVDELAQFLCDETENHNPYVNAHWPTHDHDDGTRDGGFVHIQPPDVVAKYRDDARRVLRLLAGRAAAPAGEPLTIIYTNWRGETAERMIQPVRLWYGKTDWHPEPQWLLKVIDLEKNVERDFAWDGIDFQGNGPAVSNSAAAVLRAARTALNGVVALDDEDAVQASDLSASCQEIVRRIDAVLGKAPQ